jgi:aldose 1-epimerase
VHELAFRSEAIELVVLPDVGARLHRLRVFGHDVLRTPDDPEVHVRDPFFWGGYPMAPWCGRVDAAPVDIGGRQVSLPSNFPDGSAIHGQVYATPWEVRDDRSLVIRAGGDVWPWPYDVTMKVETRDTRVGFDYTLTNLADEAMPAGIGVHPWFLRPLHVAIRAEGVLSPNQATPPEPTPVSGSFDLRELAEMPSDLDATWTDLTDPPVELYWPASGLRATLRAQAPALYVVAASPGHLNAVALEPQTHAPQAIRRLLNGEPGALAMLEPGASLQLRVQLAFGRAPTGP